MMRPDLQLVLEIEDPRWDAALPDAAAILERAIGLALEKAEIGRAGDRDRHPPRR